MLHLNLNRLDLSKMQIDPVVCLHYEQYIRLKDESVFIRIQ